MIKKVIIHNNPFLALEYYAEIEFDSGAVFYKTNAVTTPQYYGKPQYYECFFLIQKEKAKRFASLLNIIDEWESSYDKGVMIDGYRWSIITVNGSNKEIYGINDKPDELDYIMSELEILLEKDFTGAMFG